MLGALGPAKEPVEGGLELATIHLITEQEATPEVKRIYDEIKQYYGIDFVPRIFQAFAHDPHALHHHWEQTKSAESALGKEKFHLMGLAVATLAGCDYCINFHITMLKQEGYDDSKIENCLALISSFEGSSAYTIGLQLEPDVTPDKAAKMRPKRKAA